MTPVPIAKRPRPGWAKVARRIAAQGDDRLVWPEFGNAKDQFTPFWEWGSAADTKAYGDLNKGPNER